MVLLFSFCRQLCSLNNNISNRRSYLKYFHLWYKMSLWVYVWEDVMTDSDWRLPLWGPFVCSLWELYGIHCIVCMFLIPCPGPCADPTLNLFCRRLAEDRGGGGWIWIAAQVSACCNLQHLLLLPSACICTILFEFRCGPEEKVPRRFSVKLYSGPLILLGCHIGSF